METHRRDMVYDWDGCIGVREGYKIETTRPSRHELLKGTDDTMFPDAVLSI